MARGLFALRRLPRRMVTGPQRGRRSYRDPPTHVRPFSLTPRGSPSRRSCRTTGVRSAMHATTRWSVTGEPGERQHAWSASFRRRSFLKERGRSRPTAVLFWFVLRASSSWLGASKSASGSRLGRSPTAQRLQGLDAGAVRRMLFKTGRRTGRLVLSADECGSLSPCSSSNAKSRAGRVMFASARTSRLRRSPIPRRIRGRLLTFRKARRQPRMTAGELPCGDGLSADHGTGCACCAWPPTPDKGYRR